MAEKTNEEIAATLDRPTTAIDRLRLWHHDPETFDPISHEDADELLKQIDAVLRVNVKPLQFEHLGGDFWRAPAPLFGNIRVDHYGEDYAVTWSVPGITDTLVPGSWPTANEAKTAAQTHYEGVVLACLQAAPAQTEIDPAKASLQSDVGMAYARGVAAQSESVRQMKRERDDAREQTEMLRAALERIATGSNDRVSKRYASKTLRTLAGLPNNGGSDDG
ncbi:hypothetical protein [Jiella marina]|uniref:hypothetical protein n=1 Tax=Jiella sp. LLJ827 TaxID=2917712 RepID=UPI002100F7AB|nr:hypothetical protein [Jiella sp. LLJ827]MCQ0986442.1 hypothetical protein [Jiella sp. LLJ827]